MNIGEVKKELENYRANNRYIERKRSEIEQLTEKINKVTATYSDMPKGSSGYSREDLIAKKLDIERELCEYWAMLVEQKAEIMRTLQKVEPKYRNILDCVYIEGMTLEVTAQKEGYSRRQCSRLLNEAYKLYYEAKF